MSTAAQTLILIVEQLAGDDEGLKALTTQMKAEFVADEARLTALEAAVTALPAPAPAFDPTAIETRLTTAEAAITALQAAPGGDTALADRVTALEARNAADDASAGSLAGLPGNDGSPVTIGPATLPDPVVGVPYTAAVSASGGAQLVFSIQSGALPDGLSLLAGGGISGTPAAAGPSAVVIQGHDANGTVFSQSYAITVDAAASPPPAAA